MTHQRKSLHEPKKSNKPTRYHNRNVMHTEVPLKAIHAPKYVESVSREHLEDLRANLSTHALQLPPEINTLDLLHNLVHHRSKRKPRQTQHLKEPVAMGNYERIVTLTNELETVKEMLSNTIQERKGLERLANFELDETDRFLLQSPSKISPENRKRYQSLKEKMKSNY